MGSLPLIHYLLADHKLTELEFTDLERAFFSQGGIVDTNELDHLDDFLENLDQHPDSYSIESTEDYRRLQLLTEHNALTLERYATTLQKYGLAPKSPLEKLQQLADEEKTEEALLTIEKIKKTKTGWKIWYAHGDQNFILTLLESETYDSIKTKLGNYGFYDLFAALEIFDSTTHPSTQIETAVALKTKLIDLSHDHSEGEIADPAELYSDYHDVTDDVVKFIPENTTEIPFGEATTLANQVLTQKDLELFNGTQVSMRYGSWDDVLRDYYNDQRKISESMTQIGGIFHKISDEKFEIGYFTEGYKLYETIHCIVHEVGHAAMLLVDQKCGGNNQFPGSLFNLFALHFSQVKKESAYQPPLTGNGLPLRYFSTLYAATDFQEWFAENFAIYKMGKLESTPECGSTCFADWSGVSPREKRDEFRREDPVGYLLMAKFDRYLEQGGNAAEIFGNSLYESAFQFAKQHPELTEEQVTTWLNTPLDYSIETQAHALMAQSAVEREAALMALYQAHPQHPAVTSAVTLHLVDKTFGLEKVRGFAGENSSWAYFEKTIDSVAGSPSDRLHIALINLAHSVAIKIIEQQGGSIQEDRITGGQDFKDIIDYYDSLSKEEPREANLASLDPIAEVNTWVQNFALFYSTTLEKENPWMPKSILSTLTQDDLVKKPYQGLMNLFDHYWKEGAPEKALTWGGANLVDAALRQETNDLSWASLEQVAQTYPETNFETSVLEARYREIKKLPDGDQYEPLRQLYLDTKFYPALRDCTLLVLDLSLVDYPERPQAWGTLKQLILQNPHDQSILLFLALKIPVLSLEDSEEENTDANFVYPLVYQLAEAHPQSPLFQKWAFQVATTEKKWDQAFVYLQKRDELEPDSENTDILRNYGMFYFKRSQDPQNNQASEDLKLAEDYFVQATNKRTTQVYTLGQFYARSHQYQKLGTFLVDLVKKDHFQFYFLSKSFTELKVEENLSVIDKLKTEAPEAFAALRAEVRVWAAYLETQERTDAENAQYTHLKTVYLV